MASHLTTPRRDRGAATAATAHGSANGNANANANAIPSATPSAPVHRQAMVERIDADGRPWLVGMTTPAQVLAGLTLIPGDAVLITDLGERSIILGVIRDRIEVDTSGRVELTAERELTLRCGEAALTLSRTGKVVLTGTAVLSRATGVNRIVGGSVQIN